VALQGRVFAWQSDFETAAIAATDRQLPAPRITVNTY
jgi:hypothetical protein